MTDLTSLSCDHDFVSRHIGTTVGEQTKMLKNIGLSSQEALIDAVVPQSIKRDNPMQLPQAISEDAALRELSQIASQNQVMKCYIGQGYYPNHTPYVILRNVLENPAWYTAYTPYQAEISQGRLQALVNFQTMVCDLTAMPIANASMLDEATAAAEAMTLAKRSAKSNGTTLVVAADCHPQTIAVIKTRAKPLGIVVQVVNHRQQWQAAIASEDCFAAVTQYPSTTGRITLLDGDADALHAHGAILIVVADLLALALLKPPGEMGGDIVVGSTQRFGMPMGNGGPHAAYMACRDELKRSLPGRLVGASVDVHGQVAYRLALQTREQHIRREKATSNICTAQVLPAVVASMYAVYHGAGGLKRIAKRIATHTAIFVKGLRHLGYVVNCGNFDTIQPSDAMNYFDTCVVEMRSDTEVNTLIERALQQGINLRKLGKENENLNSFGLGVSLNETTTLEDIKELLEIFNTKGVNLPDLFSNQEAFLVPDLKRKSDFLTHPTFNTYHSETAMLRYLRKLSDQDLALDRSMIPLGSCTMKLNATSEMIPITWPAFAHIHPFAPSEQRKGYQLLDVQLQQWLCEATGYSAVSLQPNAGSQGEYAGLLAIRSFHQAKGQGHRNICLIPSSAHGTNPASAQMAGLQVVVTKCDEKGNVDVEDLREKCELHSQNLSCVMITYPSTHGVFETQIKQLCELVHSHGGRVYIDGANMNALVGIAAPGEFGGDVSHLNLHKTFCIPHGGGGPGVGPVCVVEDLAPFLPSHLNMHTTDNSNVGTISAAPLGNASVLPISWMYMRMMGSEGLRKATEAAILHANYISQRLAPYYPTLYASASGYVAHECILDIRAIKERTGVSAEDVAKRLIDYGFHAPTLSFPVAGTLMVEPTESETFEEIERFIESMIAIREEIQMIERGQWSQEDNPLKNAPHTAHSLLNESWAHGYTREQAAMPLPWLKHTKYWSPVGRIDNVYGDRNLFCSCVPIE